MPLVRYHIRNEYEHANPKLYSSADKDDPEGLIEGIAIAGLVGIIRQLGDLAEFAAEVFDFLHEEVMATASKGKALVSRVQQLEAELPSVEKEILFHQNHAILAYNPGIQWHPTLPFDHNHFSNAALPPFIRNYHQQCRSPPKLSLLDKFDVAGAGACMKRYSDPSHFSRLWAMAEMARAAEKEEEEEEEEELKESSERMEQQTEYSELKGGGRRTVSRSSPSPPYPEAAAADDDEPDLSTIRCQPPPPPPTAPSSTLPQQNGEILAISQPEESLSLPIDVPPLQPSSSSSPSSCNPSHLATTSDSLCQQGLHFPPAVTHSDIIIVEADAASETESFVDALATMESEAETDSEMRPADKLHREIISEKTTEKSAGTTTTTEGSHGTGEKYEKAESAANVLIRVTTPEPNTVPPADGTEIRDRCREEKPEFPPGSDHIVMKEKKSNARTSKRQYRDDETELCSAGPTITSNKNGGEKAHAAVSKSKTSLSFKQVDPEYSDTNSDTPRSGFKGKANGVMAMGSSSESETEKNSGDEDSASEWMGRISPRTSGDSLIIKPINWVNKFTRFHNNVMLDTDQEMDNDDDDDDVPSTTSSSSISSALSSPRPSALATTVFDVDLRNDMLPPSVYGGFADINGSLQHSTHSNFKRVSSSLPSSATNVSSSSLTFGISHTLPPNGESDERFPPPPPLPPLKWRTARATTSTPTRIASAPPKSAALLFPSSSTDLPSMNSPFRFIISGGEQQVEASEIEAPVTGILPEKSKETGAAFNKASDGESMKDDRYSLRLTDTEFLASQQGFEMCVKGSVERNPARSMMLHVKSGHVPSNEGPPLCYSAELENKRDWCFSRMQTNGTGVSLNGQICLSPSSHGGNSLCTISDESRDDAVVASHGRETPPQRTQSLTTSDERENMLEQIRTGSFNLRHVTLEKQDQVRPITSINVNAILEKANAIRQVFHHNVDYVKDDDGWSDDT